MLFTDYEKQYCFVQDYFFQKGFWKIWILSISCEIFLWILNGSLFFFFFFCNSFYFSILFFSFPSLLYTWKILIVCRAGHFSLNHNKLCFYPWKCFVCSVALANICSNWQTYRCSVLVCLKVDRCASHWQRRRGKTFSTAGVMWVHNLVQLFCLHQLSRNSLIIQSIS